MHLSDAPFFLLVQRARQLSLAQWVGMDFSADGKNMLVYTDASLMLTIDAYDLKIKKLITGKTANSSFVLGTPGLFPPARTAAGLDIPQLDLLA